TEHLCKRYHSTNYLRASASVHTFYTAAAWRDATHDIPKVFVRNNNLNARNCLKKNRISSRNCIVKCHSRSHCKCQHLRVNIMVRSVEQTSFDIDQWISGDNTVV